MSITPNAWTIEPIEDGRGRKYVIAKSALEVMTVPSVTTILNVQAKPGLPWWGMKVGVEGVLKLMQADGHKPGPNSTTQDWVDALTENKLTVNHVLGQAGDRGTSVHDHFEHWCRTGLQLDTDVTEEEAGYLRGLELALTDLGPWMEVEHVEVHVGSLSYGFAGRVDAIITGSGGRVEEGRWILDLKTSSGIYTSHFRQVSAYAHAAMECGYGEIDGGYILRVTKEGHYELKKSPAVFEYDFLPVLDLYNSEQSLKGK